ncbi:adhesin HecA-like repeat protein [Novosphingobium sp. SG707]|nr:hypothetical protein [Novosphingobium sp. SG707]NKJ00423.1 adhesin HecA-like repeat protein [Novosphingobium sp. SG707]
MVAQISLGALTVAIPRQALAQCSPNPSQANTAVTCSGTTTQGFTIGTTNSPLTVNSGASVANNGAAAILVSIPAVSPYSSRSASITVNGTVTATGAPGIAVTSGALGGASADYSGTSTRITVDKNGSVSGLYGIFVGQTPGNIYGSASASLDNAGTITGTSGIALYSSGNYAYLSSILNQAGGTIGAIMANATINNAGTIDGGALSAIAPGAGSTSYYASITNSGTITSSGAAGTIVNYNGPISNTGTISNTGSGAAISNSYLALTNQAGGQISAGGASVLVTAGSATITNAGSLTNTGTGTVLSLLGASVQVTNQAGGVIATKAGNDVLVTDRTLNLTNSGTITGNIVTGTGNSTIDSTAGTINGNVSFGTGNDTLVAVLKNGSLYTGVTGSIDGGAGTNTLLLRTSADATLSSALALPTNFGVLDLAPAAGTTLTLGSSYPVTSTINFDGSGTLVNAANINRSGQILVQANSYFSGGTFRNDGSITADNPGNTPAIAMAYGSINNTGTITASGAGVGLQVGTSFTNSGTITAGGTAASLYVGSGFTNSGTIRSTGGTALSLMFSCTCSTGGNSGTISGASVGLALNGGTLVNTGTISSAGTAVKLNSYSTIDNRAGGVISGSSLAITASGSSLNNVYNAGTINGGVNLASSSPYMTGNTYVALAGGVLNGDLTLGAPDTLVTSLTGAGTSGYAGINGTVYANGSALRYNVTADASDTLSNHTGFATLGYQVAGGATLTLGTSGTWGSTVNLAGTGSVVLNGSVTTTNAAALTSATVIQSGTNLPATALTITNNGTLAATRSSTSVYTGTVNLNGTADSFTNNGTVRFTDTTGTTGTTFAAVSATTVTNNGTISATGGAGVSATSLTNTGTIASNGDGVQLNGSTISNSGSITSTTGAAIRSIAYYSNANSVTNMAGGTITGVNTAVQMNGGLLSNAGTINGNVNLGYSPYGGTSYSSGAYVAGGGTISGNLVFGAGNDVLVETGSGYGVNGSIDGGGGTDFIGHQRSGTASVTLGGGLFSGFSGEFVAAAGAGSQVTVKAPSSYTGSIYVSGDGTIINQAATSGSVLGLDSAGVSYQPYSGVELGGFVNQANVGRVALNTASFSNSATIGSTSLVGSAVSLSTTKGLAFNNSGTILNDRTGLAVSMTTFTNANSAVINSGTITGGVATTLYGSYSASGIGNLSITNSGTITGIKPDFYGQTYAIYAAAYNGGSVAVTNSGVVNGDVQIYGPTASITNTGTINGNIITSAQATIQMNGGFSGYIRAYGTGKSTLSIGGGTQAAPVALASVYGISSLTQSSGFATLSGTGTFDTLAMSGGRFVGLAGSVLRAGTITVGSGATFGSAGTVNGNISVSGILSPGASPGTMTVNGNVTLNGGSISQFEITPTAQDKLNINGKLVIASGSTLQIVASTPVKAGSTLNLISASGGITGTYDTVTGLPGVVKTQANGDLGLLVQFANSSTYNPQVQRAITYVNNAMAASGAPAALFPALSALQDGNGAPIASAFARITPEPYADAMEIGAETALSLAATARTLGAGENRGPQHYFSFGQAFGGLHQFSGDDHQGISRATINGYGVLGGVGVAGEGYALTGYAGWIGQNQSVEAIGALTRTQGVVGGVALRLGTAATQITLSAAYDAARATTHRSVPDAGQISASYTLPTVSLDASISHTVALSQNWVLRPHLGATWVKTRHGAFSESSPHPYALQLAAADRKQAFIDGGISFESPEEAKGRWRRFLTLGLRYRLQGDPVSAAAALAGGGYSLLAYGAGRNRFSGTAAVGAEFRVGPGVVLFSTASGELGEASKRESVTTGLRFLF